MGETRPDSIIVGNWMIAERFRRCVWPTARRSRGLLRRAIGCGVSLLLGLGTSGCAVHYENPQTGAEHVWGLGQLRLKVETAAPEGERAAVSRGCRVAGLCLDVGRDHFGLALGYLDRQQLVIVSSNRVHELQFPTNSVAGFMSHEVNSRWAFGHLRLRGVGKSQRQQAIITGRALAGLGAGVGGGNTSLSLALDARQKAVVLEEDVQLECELDAPSWPGFDLFTAKVRAHATNQSTLTQATGEP